jgi:hypothetical protein
MLGNALIRNPATEDNKLDAGALCEALLFFSQTHIVIDQTTLGLVATQGMLPDVIEMLERGYVTASYSPEFQAIFSETVGGLREHKFVVVRTRGTQEVPVERSVDLLLFQLERLFTKAEAKSYHRQLCKFVSFQDLDRSQVVNRAPNDLADASFANEIVRMSLHKKGVSLKDLSNVSLSILPLGEGRFAMQPNEDFARAIRSIEDIGDPAGLLVCVGDARLDISLAAEHNAAFIGNAANHRIVDMMLKRLLGAARQTQQVPRDIYDFVSVDTPSVREVINSGQRTVKEFMDVLGKAAGFKKWLNGQNPNKDLIREMLREKASVGWLETLPAKTARFGLFSTAGFFADAFVPGSSLALGAVDAFLIEQMSKTWRPHFFVENTLRGFLDLPPNDGRE